MTVAVPQSVVLKNIPGIELAAVGTWRSVTGETTFTRDDLADAVAALDCPGVRNPVLKLGHDEPDSTGGVRWDGEPAVGWIDNMRLSADGAKIVGDYLGVPAWLVDAMPSAYPDRSIEIYRPFRCQIGHFHPSVITAVALLGVMAPGIGVLRSLQDVQALYTTPGVSALSVRVGGRTVAAAVRGAVGQQARPPVRVRVSGPGHGRQVRLAFNPNQPRDPNGEWGDGVADGAAADLLAGLSATASSDEVDGLMTSLATAPSVNLSRLEIEGEDNLYRKHARDTPRAEMPQLPTKPAQLGEFTAALAAHGITGELEEVDPRTLSATQNELDSAKVAQMYARAKAGTLNLDAVAFISQDGNVLDGHHRWAALAAATVTGTDVKMKVIRLDTDIDTLLSIANSVSGPRKTVGAPA